MVGTRSVLIAFVTALGLGVAGCSTMDVEDYCRYAEDRSIRDADPESLALVLGMRPGRTQASPFVVLRSLSESSPEVSITLSATAAPQSIPMNLDESRCAGVDWSTYALTVDPAEWQAFWLDERTSQFEVAIAFLDNSEALLVSEFGAAIVDNSASESLVACGCYWK